MGNNLISDARSKQALPLHTYEEVESRDTITTALQQCTTTTCTQVGLVAVTMNFAYEGKPQAQRYIQPQQSILYYLEYVRTFVRKTDRVFWHNQSLYFLLLEANMQGTQIVQTRLWEALLWRIHHTNTIDILRPQAMTIGHSAFPQPCGEEMNCLLEASEPRQYFETVQDKAIRKTGGRASRMTEIENKETELPMTARRLGIPYLSFLPQKQPRQIQQLLNPKLAQELHCYPLGCEHGTLTVAVANLQDSSALDRLHEATGLHIFPVLAPLQEVQTALDRLNLPSY